MATGEGKGGVGKLEANTVPRMIDTQQHHLQQQSQQQEHSAVTHESTDDQHQSDAVNEYTCSQCGQNDVTTDATHYCPKCDVCYCKACLCDHNVLGRTSIEKWGKAKQRGDKASCEGDEDKCLRHPGHVVTMYCVDHDVLGCQLCSSTYHRPCKNMDKLSVAAENDDIAVTVENVEVEITSLERNTDTLAKDSNCRTKFVESSHSKYAQKLKDMKKQLIAKFDEVTENVLERKHHYINKFNTDKQVCIGVKEKLSCMKRTLKPVGDKHKDFMRAKRARQWVRDKQGEMKTILNAKVTEVFQNIPNIEESRVLEVVTDVIDVRMAEMKFSLETKEDDNECEIVGLCQIANGHIIIADKANKCLKQLDQAYSVISRYQIEDTPRSICATGDSEVAVAMVNKRILIVAVGTPFEIIRTLEFEHPCTCVACQQLFITHTPSCYYSYWCGCKTIIHTYDKSGKVLKQMTADFGEHYRSDFDNDTPICISEDGEKIFVTHRRGLAVLDSQVGEIASSQDYTRNSDDDDETIEQFIKFTNIVGLCVDSKEFVYALIEGSKEIVKISLEGRGFKQIQTVNFSMDETPRSFLYDKRLSRLVMCPQKGSYIYLQKHMYYL